MQGVASSYVYVMINKYLRRLLLSEVSSFSSRAQKIAKSSTPPASTKPACTQGPFVHSSGPVRASHFSCLPPPARARHYLPSSSSSSTFSYSSADEDNLVAMQLERSHSCSKLQSRKQLLPSCKSLLHPRGASSRNHPNHAESCAPLRTGPTGFEAVESPAGGSEYTRSWSSPSLHLPRYKKYRPQRKARSLDSSSHSSPDQACSRARCAPKGHVAVYVEAVEERHLVPIAYLSHPLFQALLERAEREYGFRQEGPGLAIPCSLRELQHTLHRIRTR